MAPKAQGTISLAGSRGSVSFHTKFPPSCGLLCQPGPEEGGRPTHSLQPPGPSAADEAPTLERCEEAEDSISATTYGWSGPFTTKLGSFLSISHPEQSSGPENCLPYPVCLLSLYTFANAIPSTWSVTCPAISQIFTHPFKAQAKPCLSISGATLVCVGVGRSQEKSASSWELE